MEPQSICLLSASVSVQGHLFSSFLEKEMTTHSSILAWRIPQTKEPGGLQSMGLQSRTRLNN